MYVAVSCQLWRTALSAVVLYDVSEVPPPHRESVKFLPLEVKQICLYSILFCLLYKEGAFIYSNK